LEIANARKLASLEGIERFPNLTHLTVDGCRVIGSLAPLSALTQVEYLSVCCLSHSLI